MSDAITRKEAYLKSIGDGTSSALKPITREEQYLAYIAGESKSFPTNPITREEAFLDKIAKNGAGGGGSSINVQPLTATANGTYDAPEGQAYDPVTVDVKPITEPITITENGVYPVPKGGGLVEGETYTFKNNLYGINPADFMKTQVGSGPLDGQQYAIAMLGNYVLTYLTSDACDYMYMRDENTGACPNGAWAVTDLTSQSMMISYLYPITLRNPEDGEIVDNLGHWIYAEYRNSSSIKKVDPISITIPSPFDASVGGYSLEELAVFFEGVGGKSLDGWGDITVNVAGGGGAELNIAYGDTAPEDTSKLWVKTSKPSAVKVSNKVEVSGDAARTVKTLSTQLPTAAQYISCAAVDEQIYLLGGNAANSVTLDTICCFDTVKETLITLSAKLPSVLQFFSSAAVGKKIYLFGGYRNGFGGIQNTILCYNTETNTLTTLSTQLPSAAQNIGCAAVGEYIYLFGGSAGGSNLYNTIWRYNTTNGNIETLSATLPAATHSIACVTVGEKIYLFGGRCANAVILDTINCFNSVDGTITTLSAKMSTKEYAMGYAAIGAKVYLFGGYIDSVKVDTIRCFDTAEETLITLPINLPYANANLGCASVGIKAYLFGGYTDSFNYGICCVTSGMALGENVLQLIPHSGDNVFRLINTDTAQVEIGVEKVYKGNANGIAEGVEAALHDGSSWVTI
jgi:N-acetylneuraminic acid mutarotase